MKILLVANGNLKHKGERYYDQCMKLRNGFIRNGHDLFFISDRDIARSNSIFKTKSFGIKFCNQYFVEVCKNYQPDLIVLHHTDIVKTETILEAKLILPKVKIAQYNVDIIFNEHNIQQINNKLECVDATFITTAGKGLKKFSKPNKIVCYLPNIADKSIEWPRCFEKNNPQYDVFWALRALKGFKEEDRRIQYPKYLEKNGIKIDYYGMNGKPLLYNADYFKKIADCKIGLNISQIWTRGNYNKAHDDDLYLYSSDRISHYMGCGLLTFTTEDNKLDEIFKRDEELIFFSNKEDLLEKISFYLKNDDLRKKIAYNGWKKYHECFNEVITTKYIIERTFGFSLSENYNWPTETY
jgi:hypothetical protein